MFKMFKKDNDKGFTLVELLVVVIIIAVLAAIAIPVFINQKAGAQESAAKSDIASVAKIANLALANSELVGDAAYLAGAGTAGVATKTFTPTSGASYSNVSATPGIDLNLRTYSGGFCVFNKDRLNSKFFVYDSKKGSSTDTTSTATPTACPGE